MEDNFFGGNSPVFEIPIKRCCTRGGTRTPNLRFRRPTPYPLGHPGTVNIDPNNPTIYFPGSFLLYSPPNISLKLFLLFSCPPGSGQRQSPQDAWLPHDQEWQCNIKQTLLLKPRPFFSNSRVPTRTLLVGCLMSWPGGTRGSRGRSWCSWAATVSSCPSPVTNPAPQSSYDNVDASKLINMMISVDFTDPDQAATALEVRGLDK